MFLNDLTNSFPSYLISADFPQKKAYEKSYTVYLESISKGPQSQV